MLTNGGLKLMQITDDGCGIKHEDFPILCERFTTSKLQSFDDLNSIATFGFRGEALASITHVAHVTITSMTQDQNVAYRACFSDGVLVPERPDEPALPKPCAGVRGTQITIEDLFYNTPIRRKAMKNGADEYNKCLDIVTKYAIHNAGVSFTCKKSGSGRADVHTLISATKLDNVRILFGQAVARELLSLKKQCPELKCHFEGYFSNANFNQKRVTFILFINHRLVESNTIKKAIDAVYTKFLPKNTHPFVYLSLHIAPKNIDVNVHPTKREVQFLHEDEIVEAIQRAVEELLVGANTSRTFYTQAVLNVTGIASTTSDGYSEAANPSSSSSTSATSASSTSPPGDSSKAGSGSGKKRKETDPTYIPSSRSLSVHVVAPPSRSVNEIELGTKPKSRSAYLPQKLVRTDSTHPQGHIEAFLRHRDSNGTGPLHSASRTLSQSSSSSSSSSSGSGTKTSAIRSSAGGGARPVELTSVHNMIRDLETKQHHGLSDIFRAHTFVGCVDRTFALAQHKTKLYLLNVPNLSNAFFYEQAVRGFGNFPRFRLSPAPPSIHELLLVALDSEESGWTNEDGPKQDIAQYITDLLVQRGAMLAEYFSMDISPSGELISLPCLLANYIPPMFYLPMFLLRLGTEVEWSAEQPCFESLCRELALFYQIQPGMDPFADNKEQTDESLSSSSSSSSRSSPPSPSASSSSSTCSASWLIQHVLFPALRTASFTVPHTFANDGSIVQIACLQNLYKIFERC